MHESGDDLNAVTERLFQIVLSRAPAANRKAQAVDFLKQREAVSDRKAALTDLCHVLLNSSEFIFIE